MATKTRIKQITHADGTKECTAQYRIFPLWWEDFSYYGMAWEQAHEQNKRSGRIVKYSSLEFCKLIIDKHIELTENERNRQEAKKIASVEYIKYP